MVGGVESQSPGVGLGGRLHHVPELHPGEDLHTQHQGRLQQDALQPLNTDVIHRPGAEPREEVFGSESLEVLNGPGPEMENIIPDTESH